MIEYDDGDDFGESDPTPVDLQPDVIEDPAHEHTPKLTTGCFECNGAISAIGEWRPPSGPEEAWGYWRSGCVVSVGATTVWTFCPTTGVARVNGVRKDYDRRKEKHVPRPRKWDGVERRKAST